MRELQTRGAEARVRNHPPPEATSHIVGEGDGIALHDEVHVSAVGHSEQCVTHSAPDDRDGRRTLRHLEATEHGITCHPLGHRASIELVADHVSGNLAASAPIALDGLTDAIARWEGSSLDELRAASERIKDEFRAWIDDPANAGRPISDAPVYLDRMAVEVLIERRYFSE